MTKGIIIVFFATLAFLTQGRRNNDDYFPGCCDNHCVDQDVCTTKSYCVDTTVISCNCKGKCTGYIDPNYNDNICNEYACGCNEDACGSCPSGVTFFNVILVVIIIGCGIGLLLMKQKLAKKTSLLTEQNSYEKFEQNEYEAHI